MKTLNEIKSRLEFWWAKQTIKDGRDFDLQMDELGMLITILRGEFKGVQYRYSPLSVREDDEGLIDFATFVEYAPDNRVELPKFQKLTTNILRILLQEAIPETTTQARNADEQVMNENRDTDFSEPLEERGIHEESTPVLEKRVSKRKSRAKTVRPDQRVHSEIQQPSKPKRTGTRTPRAKRPK